MHRRAYIFLLLTTLLWGANSVAGKLAVGHVSPMTLVFLRWVLAVLILLPIGWRTMQKDWPVVRKHWFVLVALGASGFTLFNTIFYTALNYTTAINVSIEQAAMPILIMTANFVFFRSRVNGAQIAGVVLTIFGVILTACHGDPRRLLTLELNFGDAIMLVAVFLYSGYSVGLQLKPVMHWQSLILALSVAALLPVGDCRRQGHCARRPRLDGHRLYRDRCFGHRADVLYQGQRTDRRQSRRPVHQPGADLRDAAFGADRRRDVPALSGIGAGARAGRDRACRIQRAQDDYRNSSQNNPTLNLKPIRTPSVSPPVSKCHLQCDET
jgi:uncharacterized membrane protein